jgi:two-component system sensor histidine kinase TctE
MSSIVLEQSERLSGLVEQILLAAQLDSGGLQVASEHFDAAHLARNVIETSRPRLPAGLEVELATPPELPSVLGDSSRTRHVLSNLLENAIKYSPSGGTVTIEWGAGYPSAVERSSGFVAVCDEGPGLAPGEEKRVLGRFFRGGAGAAQPGTGLGLAIVDVLARRWHGSVELRNRPSGGLRAEVRLPLASTRANSATDGLPNLQSDFGKSLPGHR